MEAYSTVVTVYIFRNQLHVSSHWQSTGDSCLEVGHCVGSCSRPGGEKPVNKFRYESRFDVGLQAANDHAPIIVQNNATVLPAAIAAGQNSGAVVFSTVTLESHPETTFVSTITRETTIISTVTQENLPPTTTTVFATVTASPNAFETPVDSSHSMAPSMILNGGAGMRSAGELSASAAEEDEIRSGGGESEVVDSLLIATI